MLRGKNKEFYPLKSTGINSLKKIFILLIIAILALAFDGTLSKDIFDYQLSGFTDWMTAILIIAILLTIAWADSAKSDGKKNIPE
jgi:hypothetical protein